MSHLRQAVRTATNTYTGIQVNDVRKTHKSACMPILLLQDTIFVAATKRGQTMSYSPFSENLISISRRSCNAAPSLPHH